MNETAGDMLLFKPLYWGMAVTIILPKFGGCSRNTVRKGAAESTGLPMRTVQERIGKIPSDSTQMRKIGGGRKPYLISHPKIDEQFLSVLREHIAGNPMDEKIRWTKLRAWEVVESLKNEYGIEVSRKVVRQLLKRHDYRLCKAQKQTLPSGQSHEIFYFNNLHYV